MKNALIIFVRRAELGKVKTRLAATLGAEKALSIYGELLDHTFKLAAETDADKFVYYSGNASDEDIWNADRFTKRVQSPGDLGDKMKNAFNDLFTEGYANVVIIGSDCFELTSEMIADAFKILQVRDAVIGPANDGGYYLLGLKLMLPFLFHNKSWSTDALYNETVQELEKNNISYSALATLTDVDTEQDWLLTKKT